MLSCCKFYSIFCYILTIVLIVLYKSSFYFCHIANCIYIPTFLYYVFIKKLLNKKIKMYANGIYNFIFDFVKINLFFSFFKIFFILWHLLYREILRYNYYLYIRIISIVNKNNFKFV